MIHEQKTTLISRWSKQNRFKWKVNKRHWTKGSKTTKRIKVKLNKVKGVREKVAEKGRQTKFNIQVSGVLEEEKQKNETELKFYKVTQENFSRIKEGLNYISKEATGYWEFALQQSTWRYTIIKLLDFKYQKKEKRED